MTSIAVIDDDPVFLEMMTTVLAEYGWQVDVYRESDTALAALQAAPPDVIILDLRMERPGSGWTLLELLTLDSRLQRVPVIVCSAALSELQAHSAWLAENGIAVLPKPFTLDQLHHQIERALASSPGRTGHTA